MSALRLVVPLALLAVLPAVPLNAQATGTPGNPAAPANVRVSPAALGAFPPFDLNAFADKLEAQLAGRTVGYAFVVSFRDKEQVARAGGLARRAPDAPERPMSVDERFNVASVSKPITAAAVMKRMQGAPQPLGRAPSWLDQPMAPYLPRGWQLGTNVDRVTFRQLLTHRSGIQCETPGSFEDLRGCLDDDVSDAQYGTSKYNNTHFHLFRLLLPRLNPAPGQVVNVSPSALANGYHTFTRTQVLAPAGIPDAECKPLAQAPALAYQRPGPPLAGGTAYFDTELTCGASGWNLSARQLGRFISALLYTDHILPPAVVEQMRTQQLGLRTGTLKGDVWRTGHDGWFPGAQNPGQTRTVVVGLSNGVSVAAIVNSRIIVPGNDDVLLDATVFQALASMLP
jgi:CubicO group peptidase (beta-lactamase class C family)